MAHNKEWLKNFIKQSEGCVGDNIGKVLTLKHDKGGPTMCGVTINAYRNYVGKSILSFKFDSSGNITDITDGGVTYTSDDPRWTATKNDFQNS